MGDALTIEKLEMTLGEGSACCVPHEKIVSYVVGGLVGEKFVQLRGRGLP